ncbi:MAG: hypothetical protein AAB472_03665 [Patescibacteria group bacterium]
MARAPIFEWRGKQYTYEEKGADWYWALGIITVAAIVACILFNNVILALVVLAASGTLALLALREDPESHYFAVTDHGVVIDRSLYPYDSMISFSVLEYIDEEMPPSLSIKTKSLLSPHLMIPIMEHDPVDIYEFFLTQVPEGRHHESVFDRLIEMLRL